MNSASKKLCEVAKIILPLPNKKTTLSLDEQKHINLITPANLCDHNKVLRIETSFDYSMREEWLVKNNDIIIKRVNPQFVNILESVQSDTYTASNLIIIRPIGIYPRYLACILSRLAIKIAKSTTGRSINMQGLSTKDLATLIVPIPPLKQQELIGNMWNESNVQFELAQKLAHLNLKKEQLQLNTLTFGDN